MLSIPQRIEKLLSEGPKRAKEIVEELVRTTHKSEGTVFYWLEKLKDGGRVRKIANKYELAKFEEASEEEVKFFLKELKSGEPARIGAAKKDFAHFCRTKRVGHHKAVRRFIEEAIGGYYGTELQRWGLDALLFISNLSAVCKDQETLSWLRLKRAKLLELASNGRLDDFARGETVAILHFALEGEENFKTMADLFERFVRERAPTDEPFMDPETRAWACLFDKHFPTRKRELRRRLYALLKAKEHSRVREFASRLLDDLRLKEYEKGPLKGGGEKPRK